MEGIKTKLSEPNAVTDPIGEQAQYLNTADGKQPSCQTNVARSWRHDPLANLPGLLQSQNSFGARLADGYAPKAEVRVPGRQRLRHEVLPLAVVSAPLVIRVALTKSCSRIQLQGRRSSRN
jgi:hypothetical protein